MAQALGLPQNELCILSVTFVFLSGAEAFCNLTGYRLGQTLAPTCVNDHPCTLAGSVDPKVLGQINGLDVTHQGDFS